MLYLFKTPKTVWQLAELCKTPKRLARWVWFRISYITDKEQYGQMEHWPTAEQVLRTRKDDCDGISILCRDTLRLMGYSAYVHGIYAKDKGHAVCVYRDDRDIYWHLSNWGLHRVGNVVYDVPNKIYKNWKVWRIFGEGNKILKEYINVNKTKVRRIK